jgi:ketosteroid isomerase-like protein
MKRKLFACVLGVLLPLVTFATTNTSTPNIPNAVTMIQNDLHTFASSWNQGDLNAVIKHYKTANSTTLIWTDMVQGYNNVATYLEKNYSSKNEMGKLSTSHIEIKLLSPHYAMVTGNWFVRGNNGKKEGGPFSMLYENTEHGWKIILDHASRS